MTAATAGRDTVLVTGSAGFIGRNMVRHLVAQGRSVLGLDRWEGGPAPPGCRQVTGDLRELSLLSRTFTAHRVGAVVHAAAVVGMDAAARDPLATTGINVLGTHTLLETLRRAGGGRFVHLSTQDVYGDFANPCVDERHPIRPVSLYGVSKAAAEILVRHYGGVNLRASWVYGPGMDERKLPAAAITQAARTGRIDLSRGADSIMDFVHVDDLCGMVLRVLERDLGPIQDLNAGSGCSTLLPELCQLIAARMGGVPVAIGPGRYRTSGGSRVPIQGVLDMRRTGALLGCSPVPVERGLETMLVPAGGIATPVAGISSGEP